MEALTYARVHEHLGKLKLDRVAAVLDRVAEDAAKQEVPYVEFLDKLLEEEVAIRLARTVEMRTKLARFPFIKTMDQFDFSFQPSIDERLVSELATLRFIANAENVVFLGPPGVGKTHLAIALGLAAIAQGQHVHFLSAGELTHLLPEQMPARLAALCKPKLLIIDEMGYLPFDRPPQTSCSNWWDAATSAAPSSSPPTRPTASGATSSATRSWRRRSWTASCTTR